MRRNLNHARVIHILVVYALLAELLISYKVWAPYGRLTPEISAFEWLPLSIPTDLNALLYVLLLLGIPATLIPKVQTKAFWLVIGLSFIVILEDINRFQPWLYVQLLMVLMLIHKRKEGTWNLAPLLWLMAGTYFWAGALKGNPNFANQLFPWLMSEPFNLEEFLLNNQWVSYLIAAIEASVGILLLLPKTRRLACLLGMATHFMVFLSLGPLGHDTNVVVWPWNLMLMGILLMIFLMNSKEKVIPTFRLLYWKQKLVVVLCCAMPALHFVNAWDVHTSFSLYSGINSRCSFFFTELNPELAANPIVQESLTRKDNFPGVTLLSVTLWHVNETQVPFYPETRYYYRVMKQLCDCAPDPSTSGFVIVERQQFSEEPVVTLWGCDQEGW